MTDHAIAVRLAAGAMERLLAARREFAESGLAPEEWGKAGDHLANKWLLAELEALRPNDPVLSEEAPDNEARLGASRVWIIDPLDGTREFSEPGRTDWAVHVALSIDGSPAVGAVSLPDGRCWATGAGARHLRRDAVDSLRMVVSRSRAPELCRDVAQRIGAELLPLWSAGAKVAAVLDGRAELYLHAGGMRQWDSCAPVAVAIDAGLHASRIDGSPLLYNQPGVDVPDLLVCRPELAATVLAAIAEVQ